jgi:tRNA threonylcarbamoyladenosine biosynthesis protein TsaE
MTRRLHLATPADTHALGVRLGRAAAPGAVLALTGELGAGKTALVQGLAVGLGVSSRVNSPTFVLVCPHAGGRLPLWHADLYRLRSEAEAEALGLAELAVGGVLAVEWAERFPSALPDDRLEVLLEGDIGRDVTLRATGPRHQPLEEAAAAS